jgi:dUTP pyrophosphatase
VPGTGPSAGLRPPEAAAEPVRHPAGPQPGGRIGSHYEYCFGCGDKPPGGLHLSAVALEGVRVSATFTVTEAHQGAPGLAHGGVLAAAFDEALGMLLWLIARPAVTRRLETDFLAPVPVGSELHIEAWCTGMDGRKIYSEAVGRLGGPDGRVAVRAAALFARALRRARVGGRGPLGVQPVTDLEIPVHRLDPDLPLPGYAHPGDAGADLVTAVDAELAPGERAVLPTGIAIALPDGYAAFVHPRSGLAARCGVALVNAPGTVDSGYRGEIKVIVVNLDPKEPVRFRRGDRIAQLVVQPVVRAGFTEVAELPGSVRGAGGFGSTGGHGEGESDVPPAP